MKVIDNRTRESTKRFSELKIGETFCTPTSDKVFMKTENFYWEFDDGWNYDWGVIANAFCLSNGTKNKFHHDNIVIPLNCECVITK